MMTMRGEGTAQTGSEGTDGAGNMHWYAVHCTSRRENYAALHLTRQNFDVLLPVRLATRRHARRLETVRGPFFPGYLFVAFDPARTCWRAINGTRGVVRLVGCGDAPTPVPMRVMTALKSECDTDGLLSRRPDYAEGQPLRVVAGAFAAIVGTFDRLDEGGRVRLLLEMMGGARTARLPAEYVVAA
jgi:transcriptional antiterminator RfaH